MNIVALTESLSNSADQPRKLLQNDNTGNIVRKAVETEQQQKGNEKSSPVIALTRESAESIVDSFNNFINTSLKTVRFKIDQASEEIVIQVVDASTDEVIRQIPTEQILDLSLSFASLKGVLINEVS